MPNDTCAARPAAVILIFICGIAPAWAQWPLVDPRLGLARFQAARPDLWMASEFTARPQPRAWEAPLAGTVSGDVLRNPLSSKARHALEKAMHNAEMGDHQAAITALEAALAKYPPAAPYIYSLLGLEYIETRQFPEALSSFGRVLREMPRETSSHSNYGLALALNGQLSFAEAEERKALELDRSNATARQILEILLENRHAPNAAVQAR